MTHHETRPVPGAGPLPAQPTGLDDLLDGAVRERPDANALMLTGEHVPVTYRELTMLVEVLAAELGDRGLRPGDPVALEAANSAEFVVGLLGAARAGLVVAPIDPALPAIERATRLDGTGARVTLVSRSLNGTAARRASSCPIWQLAVRTKPAAVDLDATRKPRVGMPPAGVSERDALIMLTSGTTDRPKMVPWTHINVAASVRAICATYELGPSDATVAVVPFFHGHGLTAGLLATLASGGCIRLPARGRFTAHTFWDDVRAVEATWFTAVPTIYEILLERAAAEDPRRKLTRLRLARSCSAQLHPATARAMECLIGAPVLCAYGATETTHQATSEPLADMGHHAARSVGTATGVDLRIVTGAGRDCCAGTEGEIWVRGQTVARGYLASPEATTRSFTDGWYHTGDLGFVGTDGYLTITGRIKNLINRGGEKISPEHVECVLAACPGVAEAAVFGAPDPKYGERIVALVVARPGQEVGPREISAYCGKRLAAFEVPDDLTFVDALPHTAKGTFNRRAIAAIYAPR